MTVYDDKMEGFRQLCMRHDLTYEYSDDNRAWRNGNEQLNQITIYAKAHLQRADAVKIWNEVVDHKVGEGHREAFYWK